jgi:cyclopropane-fatty-acyl-phospholipid synthase
MRRYMWPNSCLPSATGLIIAAQGGSQGRFTLEGVENHAARMYSAQRFIWGTFIIQSSSQTIRAPFANGGDGWRLTSNKITSLRIIPH